jgi:GTP:adenosylcobinamide-phosphate guanylyltransferase
MISFFPKVRVRPVGEEELARYDPAGLSFFNVNTPEDLAAAERMARALAGDGPGHQTAPRANPAP